MHVYAVAMLMRVHRSIRALPRREVYRAQTEPDQHDRDEQLEEIAGAGGHLRSQQHERGAHGEERQRVADAPADAEQRGLASFALVRDERRHRREMIRLERVPHAEQRTQARTGDQVKKGHRVNYCILTLPMHPWHDIVVDEQAIADAFPVVVEIPKGSKNKYELDKRTGLLRLDRVLYSAVHYPADYGFVPQSYCDDGDPLDILVLGQEPVYPLTIVPARAVGAMRMRDDKGTDDKIIAVSVGDPSFADYTESSQFPPHLFREIRRFFEDYKALEHKTTIVEDLVGRSDALRIIREALALYRSRRDELRADPAHAAGR